MSDTPKHTYPDRYPPGLHWATDAAWEILDTIKPDVIPDDVRAFLAGLIAGRLMGERYGIQTPSTLQNTPFEE